MRPSRSWRAAATRSAVLSLAAGAGAVLSAGAWTALRPAGRSGDANAFIALDLQHFEPFGTVAGSSLDPGERLIADLNCISCHTAPKEIADRLDSKQPPLLGQVGKRYSPEFFRAWLSNPHAAKPGTTMPQIFTGLDPQIAGRVVEPLVHFMVSLGGLAPAPETEFNQTDVNAGRVLYHQVGCVACHAPREAPAVLEPLLKPTGDQPYGEDEHALPATIPAGAGEHVAPLASLAQTNIQALSEFLHDPVAVRPSGRMPSMNLSEDESRAIATYLIATDPVNANGNRPGPEPFTLDPVQAAKGQRIFAAMGCADCHRMGPNRTEIAPQRPVPYKTLLELKDLNGGCLAPTPDAMMANYRLSDAQRIAIRDTLKNVQALSKPLTDIQRIDRTLSAMNCYACHARGGEGGVNEARRSYFTTMGEAELGDEGRIPPPLTGVGGKLRTSWMIEVITTGAKVRPYMATRMPAWQTVNAEVLATLFEKVDAPCTAEQLATAPFSGQLTADGQRLVGTVGGFSCINCHSIKGSKPIGEPALDLVTAHERLRSDWFHTYMLNPDQLRPGTRMPNHWPPDQANPFPDVQGGDPDKQIDAIWAYLSGGEFLALPAGVPEEGGLEINVRDEPIVFRTFMKGVGPRAIAIGFKEQVHLAFDAEQCRTVEIWRGPFLNASGAWAGRGGTETDPLGQDVVTCGDDFPFKALIPNGDMMIDQPTPAFKGYRLDKQQRPILEYQFDDWSIDEQPVPILRPDAPGMQRIFDVRLAQGAASSPGLAFVVASGSKIESTGRDQYNVDGQVVCDLRVPDTTVAKVLHYQGADHLVILFGNSDVRESHFEVGMTW